MKGKSWAGDIAVDDIHIREGACPAEGDCDFEFPGFCSWEQSKTDDFDWIIGQGSTASYFTGPKTDHTTGTGIGRSYIKSISLLIYSLKWGSLLITGSSACLF